MKTVIFFLVVFSPVLAVGLLYWWTHMPTGNNPRDVAPKEMDD